MRSVAKLIVREMISNRRTDCQLLDLPNLTDVDNRPLVPEPRWVNFILCKGLLMESFSGLGTVMVSIEVNSFKNYDISRLSS